MNEKQIEFLKTINSAIKQAQESRDRIAAAVELIADVQDVSTCITYVSALDEFVSAGIRMSWQTQLAFGEGSRLIASQALEHRKQSEC